MLIPEYTDLADVYCASDAPAARDRYAKLADAFDAEFNCRPAVFARAPGRVNLIGEHIDYEGYGVLPMAITADVVVAIARGGDDLQVSSVDKGKYPTTRFESSSPTQDVDVSNHSWANYFLAAYKGVYAHAQAQGVSMPVTGLRVMVDGTVPPGSGLSSSSALVVACAVAILAVHDLPREQADVAAFTCLAERHVGVSSGGMDQAISIMGQQGHAAYIQFDPVRASPVHVPGGGAFVIANSLAESKKAENGAGRYNLRVVECRLAAMALAVALGVPPAEARALKTLREIEALVDERFEGGASESTLSFPDTENVPEGAQAVAAGIARLERCASAAQAKLGAEPYTSEQLTPILGAQVDSLFADLPSSLASIAWAAEHGGFHLRKRATHVFSEAARVLRFQAVCAGEMSEEQKLDLLGKLMDESHASCRDMYDCSCPALEELRNAAKAAGALGSRLTGAGWGGCTVSLVKQGNDGIDMVQAFMDTIQNAYYRPNIESGAINASAAAAAVFATLPASGAAVLRLSFE